MPVKKDKYITNCQNKVCKSERIKYIPCLYHKWFHKKRREMCCICLTDSGHLSRYVAIAYVIVYKLTGKKREYDMLFPCRVRLSYLRERSCLNRTRHEHVSYRPQSYSATQPGDSSASKEQRGCTQTNHNSHKSVYTSAKSKWRAHIHLFSRVYFLPLFQSRTEQPASSAKILLTLVCDGRLTTREGSTAVVFLTR